MALPRVSSSSLPPLSLASHRLRVPDLGFVRLCTSRSETLKRPLFLDGSPSLRRDPLGMIRRVGSHYSHLVRFSSKPSEQSDEDCGTLTVWVKQGSDLSAFVQYASEDHMKALFDLLEIFKDLEVVVVKGTVECEASILLRAVFLTRLSCKVEYLGEFIKNKMASTDVVQKDPNVSGERMGTAEDIGNKKLYADSATSLRFVYNGPRTSVMLIETAHNPAVLSEIIKVVSELNCCVESAAIETEEPLDRRQSWEDEIGPSTARIFSPTVASKLVCTSTSLPQRQARDEDARKSKVGH
ncbi:ACT domain [Musa troglodytarum]|uniref:ACT domain n=1 Tax=Musa troglodytarum TaxID=320322 RepID=A0A9E7KTV6_9LILI|nr:ACT domain [Musa troglodytarum]